SSVMKFSVVNAVLLLLLTGFTGVIYMNKSKEIAVVNIDAVYNQSPAGELARTHLNEVRSILEKGYEDAQKAFADNENKDVLLLDARQKLERQYVIEEHNAKMVLSRAIDNAINNWRKDNTGNIAVLSSGVVLSHNDSADITKEIMALVEKEHLVFSQLPKVEVKAQEEIKSKEGTEEGK
ncbi:TPA: OmpH family outer membrane protein, partial [Escherichia coli]